MLLDSFRERVYKRLVQSHGKTLGERGTDQKRAKQSGASGKGNGL